MAERERPRTDLSGRVCVVTGANSGIGREIARGLALVRATVVLACRDERAGLEARDEIEADTCNDRVRFERVDLADQASVRDFAHRLAARHPALHALVNNAAAFRAERGEGPGGVELTWATNVLGPFLLTRLLVSALRAGAPSRVVNVVSRAAGGLDLGDVGFERRPYRRLRAYAQSKQALRMLTWEMAERLEGAGVVANAVHPGEVRTPSTERGGGPLGALIALYVRLFGRSPAGGAEGPLALITGPEYERSTGLYFVKRKKRSCPYRDPAERARLWALCEAMTGERWPPGA